MKIVCEACQAKYSISDDKVRGKAFKIRCKKCSHIIVVRSTSASMPVADSSSAAQLPVQEGSGLTSPAPSSENSWHIVVEGEQVGPLSPSDVRARLSRGEISGDTFIWREGMADWLKISTVPEFASAGGGEDDAGTPFPTTQPPTTVYPPGTAESAFAASPQANESDVFAAPTMVSSNPTADLFASPSAAPEPAPTPSFSFGSAGGGHVESGGGRHSHSHGNGATGGSLTGQRHENSVLFSLSNLEALAAPSAAPSSLPRPGISNSGGSDGSGLIDIRSMAAMTLGSQSEARHSSDLPTFGAPQFSPVAPVLLPIGPSGGPSKLIYILIGVGLLVALALGFAAVTMMSKPTAVAPAPPAPVAVAPAPAAAPAATPTPAPAPVAATPVTPPAPTNEVLPPREQKPAAVAKGGKKGGKPVKGGRGAEAALPGVAAPSAAPTAAAKPETKPDLGKRDRLDELLDGALGTKPKAAPARREEEAPAPKPAAARSLPPLEKSDIVKAMMALNPKIHECYNQFRVPGVAMVSLKVADGGRVTSAAVTGKFANTPTGACVEAAAKTAKFPPTEAQSIQYPFPLR